MCSSRGRMCVVSVAATALCAALVALAASPGPDGGVLYPDRPLRLEVPADESSLVFSLRKLRPLSSYSVRVSWDGASAAALQVSWAVPGGGLAGAASRRLLDTEQVRFSTDSAARVRGRLEGATEVRVSFARIQGDVPAAGVPFDLVLESLQYGVLPPRLFWPLLALVLGVIVVTQCFASSDWFRHWRLRRRRLKERRQ